MRVRLPGEITLKDMSCVEEDQKRRRERTVIRCGGYPCTRSETVKTEACRLKKKVREWQVRVLS